MLGRSGQSRGVEDLLDRLPPRWLAGLAALGTRDHALLPPVRHLPPLAHLGIIAHFLHVAGVVVPDVLERREQNARLLIMEYAVCFFGQQQESGAMESKECGILNLLLAIGLVMLFYDHLLTFDDEVRLVWKAKPSMAKKLFLLNRYVVLGVLIAQAYCMILLFLF